MSSRPLISVTIATYNRVSMIERAIRSVLRQTVKDLEIIVVDDGSTDNTEALIKCLQEEDSRIKYFKRHHSGTVAVPINFGILQSKGEYVTFHASDDESEPTWLEEQLNVFQRPGGEAIDVSSCNILVVDSETGRQEEVSKPQSKDNEYIQRTSLIHNYIFGNLVVRQGFFQKFGMYDETIKIREDFDMWIRLLDAGCKFCFIYKPLYITYKHKGQSSHIDFYSNSKIALYLLEKHRKIYERYPKEYSECLRSCGVLQLLAGNLAGARGSFSKAIKKNPLYFRAYFNLLATLLGKSVISLLYALRKIFA